jgi:inner membrane protein
LPSVFTHAVAGLSLGACFLKPDTPKVVFALGAACAVVPDLDVTGLAVGFGLDHPLGHRGFSHSVAFAVLLAAGLAWASRRRAGPSIGVGLLWLYFFACTISHGLLDALTNGGRGVAFLAPFSEQRYHFPVRPIEVSPLGVREFFTERGVTIMANELVWVWLPSALVAALAIWLRRRARAGPLAARQS